MVMTFFIVLPFFLLLNMFGVIKFLRCADPWLFSSGLLTSVHHVGQKEAKNRISSNM